MKEKNKDSDGEKTFGPRSRRVVCFFFQNASKLDHEKNAPDVCRCQRHDSNLIFSAKMRQTRSKMPRDLEEAADSGKSEEEAATTIQAVYRGYKARRRFHEVSGRAAKVSLSIRYIGVGPKRLSGWDSGNDERNISGSFFGKR